MQDNAAANIASKPKVSANATKQAGIGKDPTTLTAFLPDKDREKQEQEMREQLKQEYELRQQVLFAEPCTSTAAQVQKCTCRIVLLQLCSHFCQLR